MAYWTGERKLQAVYSLLEELLQNDVPVGCVGFQMHLRAEWDFISAQQIEGWMRRFADLGLGVHVTELDVAVLVPVSEQEDRRQAQLYRDVLGACLAVQECTTFVMWGFTDKYSWIPAWNPDYGSALVFDEGYQKKPAYHALSEALQGD
jgi:endo-1,4-beta-xylanase